MLKSGLVSVSFRTLSCEKIIALAKQCGLQGIEWGGDVHILPGEEERARQVGELTRLAGLAVTSYGSYYRLGENRTEGEQRSAFAKILQSACALGAPVVRIWAGTAGSLQTAPEKRADMVAEAKRLGDMAKEKNITLAFENHPNTLTDETDSALALMQETDCNNIKLYWQPNQHKTLAYNTDAVKRLLPYITVVHTFNWHGDAKEPLALGAEEWAQYLALLQGGAHWCLLEFMPDGKEESLAKEAATLNRWIEGE